jgi:hypothetical protein
MVCAPGIEGGAGSKPRVPMSLPAAPVATIDDGGDTAPGVLHPGSTEGEPTHLGIFGYSGD